MPLFDFTCLDCQHEFEFLSLKNSELPECPECKSRTVVRHTVSLFSCTGVQVTKRLKLASEDRMKQGMKEMKGQNLRKERIKII